MIGFGWDILLLAVWRVIVILFAMRCALSPGGTTAMMERMKRTS
ncbi:hypothetical protein [Paraburkholderia dilworthii]|nr:hypothetical protein [Paraburkholderia dilworthii]